MQHNTEHCSCKTTESNEPSKGTFYSLLIHFICVMLHVTWSHSKFSYSNIYFFPTMRSHFQETSWFSQFLLKFQAVLKRL